MIELDGCAALNSNRVSSASEMPTVSQPTLAGIDVISCCGHDVHLPVCADRCEVQTEGLTGAAVPLCVRMTADIKDLHLEWIADAAAALRLRFAEALRPLPMPSATDEMMAPTTDSTIVHRP